MKTALHEANYELREGQYRIFLSVDFKTGSFTLHTKDNKCDFVFLDSKPEVALIVMRLMTKAAELAQAVLKENGIYRAGKDVGHGLD